MINGKTFYQMLGVLPDAENIVIRAAYKSLSQKYHPDKWRGDPKVANERMSELNRAYEIVSNEITRKLYDDELKSLNKESEFSSNTDQDDQFQEYYDQSDKNWGLAKEYFPQIEQFFLKLKKINSGLAFAYRETLLDKKAFSSAEIIYHQLKSSFLKRYFGENKQIQEYAELLIQSNQKNAALELNEAVQVLGDSVNPKILIKKIGDKFPQSRVRTPEIDSSIKQLEVFRGNLHFYRSPSDATKAIKFLGGEIQEGGMFFNNKFVVYINESSYELNQDEFINFAYKRVVDELNRYKT